MLPLDGLGQEPDVVASTLLASVTSGFSVVREPRAVRERFEEELRVMLRARAVSVKQSQVPATRPDILSFEVPTAPWAMPVRLEAEFEPTERVTDWQRRTLSIAAQVASLLLRIEHGGGHWWKVRRPDGAAPLIGSSTAIRRMRERIERVAPTDFTVLIEGESGPQPHPGVMGVFGPAFVGRGPGEMAGARQDS